MNYKRIIRPSEIQKEWEQKTKRQRILTKQRHVPVPIAIIVIAAVIFFFGKAAMINTITFVAKYDIWLPSEIIRIMEEIVKNNPDNYEFTIKETLS